MTFRNDGRCFPRLTGTGWMMSALANVRSLAASGMEVEIGESVDNRENNLGTLMKWEFGDYIM